MQEQVGSAFGLTAAEFFPEVELITSGQKYFSRDLYPHATHRTLST